jgi:2-dehydro-3-deoxyglucarate aldolase/4-hydroxy-2-oxoheptanedioate aldolase
LIADILFIGPWDLSFAMGILADFDHPEFVKAVHSTAEAAQQHGKIAGILPPAGQPVERSSYQALTQCCLAKVPAR